MHREGGCAQDRRSAEDVTHGQTFVHHDVTVFLVRARVGKKELSPMQASRAYITFKRDHLLYLNA